MATFAAPTGPARSQASGAIRLATHLAKAFEDEDFLNFEKYLHSISLAWPTSSGALRVRTEGTKAFESGDRAVFDEFIKNNGLDGNRKYDPWVLNRDNHNGRHPYTPGTLVEFEVHCGEVGEGYVEGLNWRTNSSPGAYDIHRYRRVLG